MKKNQEQNRSEEELRFENEFRKLKLSLETGAHFYSGNEDEENQLPPEIEKQFLDNIEAFEKALQDTREITVYDYLNRPNYKFESDLNDFELKMELEKLEELMLENHMICDVIYTVDDRVFYKFITEELFHTTTSLIKIPGFIKHFIYEEFHPNFNEDIKVMCKELLKRFYENNFNEDYKKMFTNCDNDYLELTTFRRTFTRIIDVEPSHPVINISGHLATYTLNIEFGGMVSNGAEPIRYSGEAIFKLEYTGDGDFWSFTQIKLPGMRTR